MKYKKSMIIIMLVIFLFSIAAASASDVNETAMASENFDQSNDLNSVQMSDSATHNTIESSEKIDTLNLNDNEEKLTAGNIWYVNSSAANGEGTLDNPFNNLKDTITASSDNDIIRIASGTYSGENNVNLIIDKNLTLERYGDGEAVFDGSGSYGIWEIQAKSINMTGFTFQNGYGGNGGALLFKSELINSNINANFNNNYAGSSGGAIYFAEFLTNVNIIGNFTKNSARGTGYDGEGGGAICFFAELNHVNIIGNFTDNIAQSYAGANYFKSKITNVNIFGNYNNNTATGQNGGANWFSALLNVNIIGNYSNNKAYFGGANVFYEALENVNITGNYINNTATNFDGGANQFRESLKNVAITGDYSYNKARDGGANWFSDTGSLNNVNITGNYCHNEAREDGGAIYLGKPVHVNIIGNYTNNTAKTIALYGGGGAIFVLNSPTELTIAANFYNNTAVSEGAAILFYNSMSNVDVTGNFINNKGKSVIYNWGTSNSIIHDSIFINNSKINVDGSGTIKIVNTWFGNNATNYDTAPGENRINFENWLFLNATVDSNIDDDSKITNITFKLSSYNSSGVSDYNNNLLNPINLTITATNGNIAATARLGETIQFTPTSGGTATVTATVENAIQTVEIPVKGDFDLLQDLVNNESLSVINLERNYTYNQFDTMTEGVVINRAITINGNGYTINANGKTRIFKITSDNVVLENITFVNGNTTSTGGAVYFSKSGGLINCNFTGNTASNNGGAIRMDSGTVSNCNFADNTADYGGAVYFKVNGEVTNCNFTNNFASNRGGAVYFYGNGDVTNCNFTNNSARYGGAIEFDGTGTVTNCNFVDNHANRDGGAIWIYSGTVSNCNFTGNNATTGSAIYFYKWDSSATLTVSNSTFLNNRANARALNIVKTENNITITFTGQNNLLNAIYSIEDAEVAFTNVTYWGAKGITTVSDTMSGSNKATGQNITVGVVVNNELVLSDVMVTDKNGIIVLDISAGENYYISARHNTDSYYTEAERTISNNTKFSVNVTSQTTTNKTVNITAKSNIPNDVVQGKLLFIVPNSNPINATYGGNGTWWAAYTFDDAGDYNVNASYIGLDNVTINNATIAIRYDARVDVNNKTLDLLIKDTFTIVATTTPEGLNVSYVPDDSGVYSIDENGVVTALRDGKGSILIKVEGNAGFAVNSTIVNVTVSKIPTEINVLNDTLVLAVCDEIDTGATLTPGDAGNVTYSISNSSVVKVEDGNIIALAEGKANITVSFEGNKKYLEAKNKTISVTVELKDAKVTADDLTLDVYANATISPVTSPEGLEVEYASGNISIAEVDVNGVVTGYNAGNTTITITTKADGVHAVNSTTINVSVNTINSTIDVNDTVLNYGETTKVNVTTDGALGITAKFDGEEIIFSGYSVPIPVLNAGNYNLTVTTIPDDNHKSTTKTVTITVLKQNTTADISIPANMAFGENSTVNVKLPNDASGNVTLKVDGAIVETVEVSDGSASLNISELSAGNHTVEVSYSGDDNHNPVAKTATITVYKKPTNITAAGVTTTYNINKNLVIALTDCDGNPLSDVNVTVELNTDKIYTTDENGKIVINVGSLTPNTYAATITFKGNENYTESNTTANVVVKKATPKMTVKAKTFKDTTKTKKYTITLKDNKGNPIKNAKVTLKVNGKTYKATTDSKGKAIFKITKLNKKGTYKAAVTYTNKYYNKATKKVKITVKPTFKTVSKGSKDTKTVKKIQRALKDNGYYLTYKGHYLKVDGKYNSCTVRSVKEFQHDKGLKVTGKVDEKTAKKLKII